jgi:hypothetical protein
MIRLAARLAVVALVVGACGSPLTSPSPSSSSASPSPVGSSAVVPSASSTLDARQIAQAFLDSVGPDAVYRSEELSSFIVGSRIYTSDTRTVTAGADSYAITDAKVGSAASHLETKIVDGLGYRLGADGTWSSTGPASPPTRPFNFLAAGSLRDDGPGDDAGEAVRHLELTGPISLGDRLTALMDLTGGTTEVTHLDAFVEADGEPVSVSIKLTFRAADGSVAGTGTIEQDYSDFDTDLKVTPPADV